MSARETGFVRDSPYGYRWVTIARPKALLRAGGRVDPIWRGNELQALTYRGGARCTRCHCQDWEIVKPGVRSRLDVAHLDGDTANEADDNLAALCRTCHRAHDFKSWALKYSLWVEAERQRRIARKDAARPILNLEAGV